MRRSSFPDHPIDNLANLVGPLVFHTVCMVLGGVFFQRGIKKAPAPAGEGIPAPQAR